MFDTTRALINNVNHVKYLKNFNRVKQVPSISSEDTNNLIELDKSEIDKLELLEGDIRINNLLVFLKNYSKLRTKRLLLISAPIAIVAYTASLFIVPPKIKTREFNKYEMKTTYINSDVGQFKESEVVYYDRSGKKPIESSINCTRSVSQSINYRIADGINAIEADFSVSDSGKIKCDSISSGTYIDGTMSSKLDNVEIEENYVELFDKLLKILEENIVRDETIEKLKSIKDSDKKRIIIEMKEYVDLDETIKLDFKDKRIGRKILFIIICVVYGFGIYLYLDENYLNDGCILENNNGKLEELDSYDDEGIIFGPLKYRELFVAAEKDRIRKISEIASKNLDDPNAILTMYEKDVIRCDERRVKRLENKNNKNR